MTVINTNVAALSAQSSMMKNTREMENAMAKLSSGHRINTAADDAAGLSISERLDSQIRGLSQAIRNSQDAQNMIDTVEGASAEIVTSLQRLRELAAQSASSTNTSTDRSFLATEAEQLVNEINRIAEETQWNGMYALDGSMDNINIQVGANVTDTIKASVNASNASSIGHYVIRGDAVDTDAAADAAVNGVSAGNTSIKGYIGEASFVVNANDTAKEYASDVNEISHLTGVTAKASTNMRLSSLSAAGTVSLNLGFNGTVGTGLLSAVTVTAVVEDENDLTTLRDAINDVSSKTGVAASFMNGRTNEILLTDHDGDDIVLGEFDHLATDDTTTGGTIVAQAYKFHGVSSSSSSAATTLTDGAATDSVTARGEIELSSKQAFVLTKTAANFFGAGTEAKASLEAVGDIDISTIAGAEEALSIIDGAIDQINSTRSNLGAVSNRLDKTISNLTNIVENTTASKSHIKDANFAQETSALTKAQILNQAATSMLAQANASKQTVLALLQN